ncbi:MAG: SpoIIE family protein phosphatase [Cyclobacteriaceae bacterium]|nr:SpoIIE family protein phosphatase [Cyclobacteriaceae bacterium]MCH8515454.1 SpoIIE family protein phosphatase [Cyclobacteriaceae bacterium]
MLKIKLQKLKKYRVLSYVYIFFLSNISLNTDVLANETVVLSTAIKRQSIVNNTTIFQDSTKQLGINDLIELKDHFDQVKGNEISLGYTNSILWAKFEIKNQIRAYQNWLLRIPYNSLNFITLYKVKDDEVVDSLVSGNGIPFRQRDFKHNNPVFPLGEMGNGTYTFYIKVDSESTKQLPLLIYDYETFYEEKNVADLLYGMFFGIMIVMIIYNLFIFLSLRDYNYLIYVGAISASVIFFASFNGYTFQYLWPNLPRFSFMILPISVAVWVIFSAYFARSFLETKRHTPILNKLLIGVTIIAGIGLTFGVFDQYAFSIRFAAGAAAINSILIITAGMKIWVMGYKTARYFTAAWLMLLLGAVLLVFQTFGWLPANFITMHAVELGAVLEVTLLSLALSDKFSIMKKEKEIAQEHAINLQRNANQQLELKVKERTFELNMQKEKIESSVRYAKRIQDVMLNGRDTIKSSFIDSFIFFKPRDIVSGDFYWVSQQENKTLVASVDCTGHGVPGAFMSLLGYNLLNEIVINQKIMDPSIILKKMDKGIRKMLNQEVSKNKDGMDLSLIAIDHEKEIIEFAGAKNPMIFIQNGDLSIIKGDKYAVGGVGKVKNKHFSTTVMEYSGDTMIYLYSDGFQDQFGGPKGRKYMTRRFREFLFKIHTLACEEQEEHIDNELNDWMEEEKQIDDILIIGLKLSEKDRFVKPSKFD